MSLLFWCSLVFFGVVAIGGIVLVAVRTLEVVRVSRRCVRILTAGAEPILNGAAGLEQRSSAVNPDRVTEAVQRLERSLERGKILLREARRVQGGFAAVRAAVPRK
jgi:hypothetical protein